MSTGPKIKMNGYGVRLDWPEHNLFVTLDRFRDSSAGTKAELSAYVSGEPPRLLTQARLNLDSLQGRASFARRLTELHPSAPWADVLENASVHALQLRRRGEPIVMLTPDGPVEPVCYRVNPLCFEGHPSLVFSDGGLGKSWVGLLSSILVEASGTLGSLRAVPGRSLLLDWEQDAHVFNDRFRRLATAHIEWVGARPLYKKMLTPLADEVQTLAKTIEAERVSLVVLDSLGPAAGGDICSAETAMRTMSAIRALGVTVLLLAHISKASSDRVTPFGSVFFRNLARSAWRLDSIQEGDTLRMALTHDKSNFGRLREPVGLALHFTDDAVQVTPFDPQAEPVTEPNTSVLQRILQVLEQSGPQTAEALAGMLGLRVEPIRAALSKEKGARVRVVEKHGKQYVWALGGPRK